MARINTGKFRDLGSDMQSQVNEVAQDVAQTFQENRPLMYAGIGLLALAAGVGIWALVRQFSSNQFNSEEPQMQNIRY